MKCCEAGRHTSSVDDAASIEEVRHVLEGCKVVFLVFYVESCGICRAFLPIYESVAGRFRGSAAFLRVDANRLLELASALGVMSVPSTIVVINGRLVGFFSGFLDEDRFMNIVERTLEYAGCL
ncbi:MAG: thioredoxin family protein [Desulfurococcales archaeon]|nr:thioredoxin family protein [Desulfurococcales archaeon]